MPRQASSSTLLIATGLGLLAGLALVPCSCTPRAVPVGPPGGLAGPAAAPAPAAALAADAAVVEQEVRIPAGGSLQLAGTLYQPAASRALPGVVLVQGSGPTDRHWNNPLIPGPVETGRVLARHLAAAGMAVLAFDKRGTGGTPRDPDPPPSAALDDVAAALAFLRTRAEVRAGCLALVGHSEGAGLSLRLAASRRKDDGLQGLVLLMAMGRSTRLVLAEQVRRNILSSAGVVDEATVATNLQHLEASFRAIFRGEPPPPPPETLDSGVGELIAALVAKPGAKGCRICGMQFDEDPAEYARQLDLPTLLAGGGRDLQITRADLEALRAAAPHAEALFVAEMDHVLKQEPRPVEGLAGDEIVRRYAEPRPVAPELLKAVTGFLRRVAAERCPAAGAD